MSISSSLDRHLYEDRNHKRHTGVNRMFRSAFIAVMISTGATIANAQATSHRIDVNGLRMYYEVSGSGEPLIVLHGAYMNIPSMGAIIPRLAQTHKVYALELQG